MSVANKNRHGEHSFHGRGGRSGKGVYFDGKIK